MPQKQPSNNLLWQYAGLASQLMITLLLALYLGDWVDKKLGIGFSLLVWILPLLVLVATFIKLIKDTSKKK
ncbi:MAG: hypothetical protein WCG74_06010 [Sediminibacterium sp.]|jgi:hypothetical protein